MERCDAETVWRSFFFKSGRKFGGGRVGRSLGFEIVLGFLSKGRDLQDLISGVNLRTRFPKRF